MSLRLPMFSFFFFFNDTATTEIYTLSLHDALPISRFRARQFQGPTLKHEESVIKSPWFITKGFFFVYGQAQDRKSTRLNSSHGYISYAVFCLKKKKKLHN